MRKLFENLVGCLVSVKTMDGRTFVAVVEKIDENFITFRSRRFVSIHNKLDIKSIYLKGDENE